MPRLQQINKAEADPVEREGARFIDPGKKRALLHEGRLDETPNRAQDLGGQTHRPRKDIRIAKGNTSAHVLQNLHVFFMIFCGY